MLTLLPVFSMTPTERNLSHAGTSSVTRMVVSLRICLLPHSPPALRSQVTGNQRQARGIPGSGLLVSMLPLRQTSWHDEMAMAGTPIRDDHSEQSSGRSCSRCKQSSYV